MILKTSQSHPRLRGFQLSTKKYEAVNSSQQPCIWQSNTLQIIHQDNNHSSHLLPPTDKSKQAETTIQTAHHNGLHSRPRPKHRSLEALAPRQAGAAAIRQQREPEGQDTRLFVVLLPSPSHIPPSSHLSLIPTRQGGIEQALILPAVHNLTDVCWRKCITGNIRSGKLEKNEDSCMQNCVERFMDANFTVIKHLETMRNQG